MEGMQEGQFPTMEAVEDVLWGGAQGNGPFEEALIRQSPLGVNCRVISHPRPAHLCPPLENDHFPLFLPLVIFSDYQ